jgi:hypothetical protein
MSNTEPPPCTSDHDKTANNIFRPECFELHAFTHLEDPDQASILTERDVDTSETVVAVEDTLDGVGSLKIQKQKDMLWRARVLNIIETLTTHMDKLSSTISELQDKVDMLEEASEKPSGCGFSCSHNSFNMQ